MNHNVTITYLPILVDCGLGQKEDGLATWADNESHRQKKVKIFGDREAESYKGSVGMTKAEADRFERLKYLTTALLRNDEKDIALWQDALIESVDHGKKAITPHAAKGDGKHFVGLASPVISKMLSGVRLVFWQAEKGLRPALYCGGDLKVAFRAYMLGCNFVSTARTAVVVFCPLCGSPFEYNKKGKKYCCTAHRAAAAQRKYRARLKKKQRRTRP